MTGIKEWFSFVVSCHIPRDKLLAVSGTLEAVQPSRSRHTPYGDASFVGTSLPGFRQSQGGAAGRVSALPYQLDIAGQHSAAAGVATNYNGSRTVVVSEAAQASTKAHNETATGDGRENVFQQFVTRLSELGFSVESLFEKYDTGHTGQLTCSQVGWPTK
jgi:hypothetical protein